MKLRNILINSEFAFLWWSLVFLTAGLVLSWPVISPPSQKTLTGIFTKEIQQRQSSLISSIKEFSHQNILKEKLITVDEEKYIRQWEKNGFLFLVYQKDSLVFWSDNSVPFPVNLSLSLLSSPVNKLANGWYLTSFTRAGPDFTIVGLALIKHDFPYENEFLTNDFHNSFSFSSDDIISLQPPGSTVLSGPNGPLLYFRPSLEREFPPSDFFIVFALFLISSCFFFLFLFKIFQRPLFCHKRPVLCLLLFSLMVILFRIIQFSFRIPAFLYSSDYFSPSFFAYSIYLPSLADFLTNTVLLLFLSVLFFKTVYPLPVLQPQKKLAFGVGISLLLLVTLFFFCLVFLFDILISNSSFSLTNSDPFSFVPATVAGFIILVGLSLSYFLFTFLLLRVVHHVLSIRSRLAGLLSCAVLLVGFLYFFSLPALVPGIIFISLCFIILFAFHRKKNPLSLPLVLSYILILSFLSTQLILNLEKEKETSQRKILAQKLSTERDLLAEYLVQESSAKIKADPVIKKILKTTSASEDIEDEVSQYISRKYFGSFWTKYNLEFTLCTRERVLNVVIPYNTLFNCQDYFTQTIKTIGKPTISHNLYFLDYGSGSVNYLAVLPFTLKDSNRIKDITIYIDITSKAIPKGVGYPELLIGKESRFSLDINKYSYAVYKKDELVRSFGKYSYPLNLNAYGHFSLRYSLFVKNAYSHLLFNIDKEKTILVSLKRRTLIDDIAPFSYFSLLLSIFTVLLVILLSTRWALDLRNQNFRSRLQLTMTLLILFSFIIIGITTGYYIVRLNQTKNVDILTEKAHSILIEIQQNLGKKDALSPDMANDLFFVLNKLSLVFFSDINLYDPYGNLIASSRPLIFEEGLVATKMNWLSFSELSIDQKSLFIHQDKIGSYRFLSAYLPFRNEQDKLIGYLNLPYFARQDEIRTEISAFLVAFINIYVLLVAFSILLAIVISSYVTKPLLLIKEKISKVKLGKPNEKIEWKAEDEIGGLIVEYNSMIDKLALSADQLARSERETAWREMAKQVAHEIKNPLTPMKLSIQHLIRSYDEKAPDLEQRLKKFSNTLIEQIDILSDIASEFSDFAKMPMLKKEKINLYDLVISVAELHKQHQHVTVDIECLLQPSPVITGDKNQILRVLVNLFRNSLQALETVKKGKITIALTSAENYYLLSFNDDGTGIPAEQQQKIFSPNFTTKTGGMGLGLAMVKSIMEDHGGRISFESEPGTGTTFFLFFRKEEV
ncbi:MAG: ATP-binding protein [Bacteroidetes bacterium]|nr:ATP-binding protein [Bacteroidota bacterium]